MAIPHKIIMKILLFIIISIAFAQIDQEEQIPKHEHSTDEQQELENSALNKEEIYQAPNNPINDEKFVPADPPAQNPAPKDEAAKEPFRGIPLNTITKEDLLRENDPDYKHHEVNPDDPTYDLAKEWEEHMKDFVPDEMITFEMVPRGEDEFYADITISPSHVRGAWFISSKETTDIDFFVVDPRDRVLIELRKRKEAVFWFDAMYKGQYFLRFKNYSLLQKHYVTLALHTGNSTEEILLNQHLEPVEQYLVKIQKGVKDFQVDNQFATLRMESHYRTVASANDNLFWFSILESFGVAVVTFWQMFYIKKLLENRRML
ncbi:unnamed protein product [Blepharisma stoltei]|uniref:GOLD domain-containing protein n=1 Tax=Blepharisma stoltei TaxID=1481888 RepID=A0AAU9KCV3_9CILI|nr:unnamed protein product [Blepharisma stoltei]